MNELTTTNPVGRPLKFQNVQELEASIDEYFKECEEQKVKVFFKNGKEIEISKPPTMTGLALKLGTTRETLVDYQKMKFVGDHDEVLLQQLSDSITRAKMRCEDYAEAQLFIGSNPAGTIFSLKNNYGWKDQQSIDLQATAKQQQDYSALSDSELEEQMLQEIIEKRPEIVARLMEKNP